MTEAECISYSVVTPLGASAEETFSALRRGESALRTHEGTFGCREPFVASLFGRDAIPCREGLSFFETIAFNSAADAVRKAGIDPSSPRTAFILATIKGNVEYLGIRDGIVPPSYSATKIASALGVTTAPVVVSNACISSLAALIQGCRMIGSGLCDNVIVTGTEVQSRFIVEGFQSLKALSQEPCKPFDRDRDGLNLGEAAATMVLGRCGSGMPWRLSSGTIRNDANHISGPSRTGEGSFKCLRHVLEGLDRKELAFVSVHGTSTLYNDEMESIALSRAGLSEVPLNSLKGFFGHTMGAAGLLEGIISMMALEHGIVLPTRGFTNMGVSCPVNISPEERPAEGSCFIKLLSGFGGVNGALLFKRGFSE